MPITRLSEKHRTPYAESNNEEYSSLPDHRRGRFYFTEKAYERFKDLIYDIVMRNPELTLKIISLYPNSQRITWKGKSGLQVTIR